MVVSASGAREANADFGVQSAESGGGGQPFLGAYIHLSAWFRGKTDEADRERAIMDNLDRFRESGLRILIPFVTTTRGDWCAARPAGVGRRGGIGQEDLRAKRFRREVWHDLYAVLT